MNVWQAGLSEPLMAFLKNPTDIMAVEKMYECYSKDANVVKAVEKKVLADARFKKLYETWYTPEPFTLEDLLTLPEDTFGYHYSHHMKKNGYQLNFINQFKGKDVLSYIWFRAGHVHDITHIIVGYDTSFMGELALKGFEMAQYLSPATAGILGGGLLAATAIQPEIVGPSMEKIMEGYNLGKRYPLLMGIRWDQEWETPLHDLRMKYDIPAPSI